MNRHLFGVLFILAGVFAVSLEPPTEACEPARVVVGRPVKKVVVVEEVVAVQAAILQPLVVPVVVPSYGVGYSPQYQQPAVQAPAVSSPCANADLLAEVRQLRAELAALRNGQQLPPKEGVPQPQPTSTRGARGLAVLQTRCIACHSETTVAKSKSDAFPNGVLLFKNGKIDLEKDAGRILEQVESGKMPKGGAKLAGDDLASVIWYTAVKEDAPTNPPAPPKP